MPGIEVDDEDSDDTLLGIVENNVAISGGGENEFDG